MYCIKDTCSNKKWELTSEEFQSMINLLKGSKKLQLKDVIEDMVRLFGIEETKSIFRQITAEIEEEEREEEEE